MGSVMGWRRGGSGRVCDPVSPVLLHKDGKSWKLFETNYEAWIVWTDVHSARPCRGGDGGVHFAANGFHCFVGWGVFFSVSLQ